MTARWSVMAEFTSTAIRPVGEIRDALGRGLAIGADCDAVVIAVPGIGVVYLDARQRDEFIRLYFEAERQAEAWAAEHAGGGS
jgi:hypothetical protein